MVNKSNNPPAPSASGYDEFVEDEGIDLRQYWRVVLRHKWRILGLVFAVGLFTTVWAFSLEQVYRSSATLLIGGNEAVTVSSQDEYQSRSDKAKFLGTQYELLKSRKVMQAVLQDLGADRASILALNDKDSTDKFDWRDWVPQSWLRLDWVPSSWVSQAWFPQTWLEATRSWLAGKPSTQAPIDASDPDKRLLDWLRNGLQVAPVRDTSMVKVSFEATEPKLAARIANAVTRAYIEDNLKQRVESSTEASAWLQEQLEKSEQHVMKSADTLQEYREEAGLVDVGGMQSIQTDQLKDRTDRLSEARRVRSEAESLYQRAVQLREQGQMDALPAVFENPRIQRLRDEEQSLERQIRIDSERYQGNYPGLDDSRSNLQAVREQINETLDQLVEGFRTDFELARDNQARLQREVRSLERSIQKLDVKQVEAKALEHTLDTNRQAYEAFLNQLMETRTRSADTVSMIARVIDPAVPEFIAVKPNKRRMLMISLLLSLMGGVGIALMLDKLDNTLKSREDVQERLGVPVLGELVMLKGKRADGKAFAPQTQFTDEPTSSFAECVRTIRTGVVLSGLDQSHQTLVVTSTVAGEGKSTVALNLAQSLGQLGKVLLIDADLRRPSLARQLGLDARSPGLTDVVAGSVPLKNCIHKMTGGIYVLFAGSTVPPDPIKILSSKRFSDVMTNAAAAFENVVIDSAPVELVSDARMLASRATGVIYVVKADATPHQAVHHGLSALIDTGTPLLGIVLNQIDPDEAHAYGKYKYGYSRYGAYSHYSYGHDPKSTDGSSKIRSVG